MREVLLNPHFKPFFNSQERYLLAYGGAGSGKSISAMQKLIMRCLEDNIHHRILAVRKTKESIRESIFKLFREYRFHNNLESEIDLRASDYTILFPRTGSEIVTTGMDDPEKIKSIAYITGTWLEEGTELDYEDFNQIDLRLRGNYGCYRQHIITFNPIDEEHWLKKNLVDAQKNNILVHHSTVLNNPFIDEDYKRVLADRYAHDENLSRIYIRGEWGRLRVGGEYYSNFKYSVQVKPCVYNESSSTHISFDFNTIPYMSMTVWQMKIRGKNSHGGNMYDCYCVKEYGLTSPNNKTEALCETFLNDFKPGTLFYYGDASGKHADTRGNENDYDIINRVLRRYLSNSSDRKMNVNPRHRTRRDFINKIFYRQELNKETSDINIFIDPSCKLLIGDLESVVENPDGGKLKKMTKNKQTGQSYEEHTHMSDTMDYFICKAFESLMK